MGKVKKNSRIEWDVTVPGGWNVSKLKYVATFQPNCDTSELTEDSEITYTPMECIKNGYFVNNTALYGSTSASLTPYNNGDIVIAKVTPCFENGNIAIMEGLASGYGLGSSELFVLRPKSINTRYLFYWLQNDEFKQQGCATMTGTGGLKRVSPYFMRNCFVAKPSIEEQERIVSFLDQECSRIDEVIEKTKASIEEYKKLKQSVITQAVTKGIRPNRKMKDSGIEWIGEMPAEWKKDKGKWILSKLERPVLNTDNVITCFRDGQVTLRSNRREDGFTFSLQEVGYQGIEPGDLVVHGMDGFAGAIGISDSRGKGTPVLNVLDSSQNKQYVMYYLRSMAFNGVFLALATGIRVRSCDTNWNKLKELFYPLPSLDEQQEIADYIDEQIGKIDSLIERKTMYLSEIENYKKSLIFEYVTGKKEVPA